MERVPYLLTLFSLLISTPVLFAAQFQNLDFESVIPPLVPVPGDPFMRVPIGNALPFWQGFVGDVEQTNVGSVAGFVGN